MIHSKYNSFEPDQPIRCKLKPTAIFHLRFPAFQTGGLFYFGLNQSDAKLRPNNHWSLYKVSLLFDRLTDSFFWHQERKAAEEAMKKHELELDYLAPFLAQIGDPPHISRQEAYKLKEECLQDLKHRLIDKANLIQARFEKVSTVKAKL